MIRWLIRLPFRLLYRLWRLIWGLFQAACVFVVVALIWAYFSSGHTSNRSIGQYASNVWNQVVTKVNGSTTTDGLKSLSLSGDTASQSGTVKWPSPTASVYISSTDERLVSAYQEAIANWNATGAFTFTYATSSDQADIVAGDEADSSSQAAGLADTTSNALTGQISHVDVTLNTYYLLNAAYGYSSERIVHTAEHELGHAIGLSHDDSEDSVMQSAGSYYGIQETDINKVKALYAS
ncbi:M57 family metalloprotease [Streptococcus sp. DD12]|uniref:M57 family metalloprotease n=1 Tax=Streptococcus sp. DD12 TaxID=1777880 RepID=UPI000799EDA9|nr:M57 family metalloprotease [Streptococcus sp. DD12]KXT77005.1 putative Zn-dependent protease [Streptococcus sp. DD12]